MSRQYEQKVLRKLQLAQCKVLEDFIEICEANKLDYFIFSGCAIGVERHQGFIPWDDDIDIGMLRKDYNRFLKIAKRDYAEKYNIIDISEDGEFPFLHAWFNRKGTKNVAEIFRGVNIDANGIGVAIYPFDNVSDNLWQRRRQLFSVFFWHKIKILREFGHPVLLIGGWKKRFVSAICIVGHTLLKSMHVPHELINKKFMKSATKYNNIKTESISCFFSTTPTECMIKRSDLFPLVSKKFEYLMVKVPNKNHEYLTQMYGSYMEMPPVEKRRNHIPYILEFGDFEDINVDM